MLGLTNKYGWYVTVSTKKVIEVGRSKKNTFSFKADFFHFFCEKVNLLTAPVRRCRRCGQFDIGVAICVLWLAPPPNKSGEGFKIFSQCWTTLPIWHFSNILDLQNVHMFIFNPMILIANTQLVIEFEHVNMLKIQNVWKVSDAFAVILPQQRPVLVSAYAQNFFSEVRWEKKVAGKCKLLSPQDQDSYRGD